MLADLNVSLHTDLINQELSGLCQVGLTPSLACPRDHPTHVNRRELPASRFSLHVFQGPRGHQSIFDISNNLSAPSPGMVCTF